MNYYKGLEKIISKIRKRGILFILEDAFLFAVKSILPYNIYNFLYAYDDWMRVYSVRKLLRKIDPYKRKKIIDIGGGWGNLERGLKRDDIVIYEPNRDYVEKAKKYVGAVIQGKGEYLNVKDKEFDISMSVHTFEHIDKSYRSRFVQEMTRVASQYVILIFPFEKWADRLCNDIIKYCGRIDVMPSTFTIEHIQMGIPNSDHLKQNLELINSFKFS